MRHHKVHPLLPYFLLMLGSFPSAFAQTAIAQPENHAPATEEIMSARAPYSQRDHIARSSGDHQARSEFNQRRRPLISPTSRYPRAGYPAMWRQRANGRHVLIGALIGFGIGAAVGAKANKDPNARVSAPVLFGGFGALIGAGIGASHP